MPKISLRVASTGGVANAKPKYLPDVSGGYKHMLLYTAFIMKEHFQIFREMV